MENLKSVLQEEGTSPQMEVSSRDSVNDFNIYISDSRIYKKERMFQLIL